ncbi:MAG: sensor histidine kinase, partial [Bacteroidota bacterium]
GTIIGFRNLDSLRSTKPGFLEHQLELMRDENDSITINISPDYNNYIFYRNSILLRKLGIFPYVQLAVIMLFIFVSYIAFSVSRKAEQNEVWTGLTKETAHQLGTPVSSLLGWVEIIKSTGTPPEIAEELRKDVSRLEKITERFSKIGAKPSLVPTDIRHTIQDSIQYLRSRVSNEIIIEFMPPAEPVEVPLNETLFSWVIENLCKNSMDAIEGKGKITVELKTVDNHVLVDVGDTGKGIPKSKYKTVFKPGYTTKKRGWGLGLSLSSRIVEMYHNGKIFVLASDPGSGTVIRIQLPV